MLQSRGRILMTLAGAAGVFASEPLLFGLQGPMGPKPQPLPSPNARNPNYPPGLNGPDSKPTDAKAIKKKNQAELKADVEKLSQLVAELKAQTDKIDSDATLSLTVVKKAQANEKLAKQIKDLAKG
jgi:hypothetical protein